MKLDQTNPITQRGHNRYLLELRQLARDNRKNPTKAEAQIWYHLLKDKYLGYRFLRQKPIDQFILDFYAPKLLLDVEVDGDSHLSKAYYDQGRDQKLLTIGIKTLRYSNNDILKKLNNVVEDLKIQISKRKDEI